MWTNETPDCLAAQIYVGLYIVHPRIINCVLINSDALAMVDIIPKRVNTSAEPLLL